MKPKSYVYRVLHLVLTDKARDWCGLPYPRHKKGCPNFNCGKSYCPPQAPKFQEFFDMDKPLFLIHSEFDLVAWEEKMKSRHPNWSKVNCRNVIRWQPISRTQLKERIKLFMLENRKEVNTYTTCPEAMGLNVYATAALSGLKLEKIDGLKICRHVAIIGTKNRKEK